MKIKVKLLLGVIAFSIAILVACYFVIAASQNSLKDDIAKRSILLTKGLLDDIDNTIHLRAEEIRSYSQDTFLQEQLVLSNADFGNRSDVQAYIDSRDAEWRQADDLTPFMKSLIGNELSNDLRKRSEFYKGDSGKPVFPEIFVTNKYGANVGQTGRTSDYRQDDEAWWVAARDTGFQIQDVEYDKSAGVYSTDILVRVNGPNGEFLGVVKATLRIDESLAVIQKKEGYDELGSADFKLLTGNGDLIYSTKAGETPLMDVTNKPYYAYLEGKDQGSFISSEGGVERLSSFSRSSGVSGFEGFSWILVIDQDSSEVFGPVTQLRNQLLLIFSVMVLFGLLGGFFISRSIVMPIEVLARNSSEIGKGKFDTKSGIKRKDEIGTLAVSIDRMVDGLKKLEEDKNNFLNIVSHELKTPLTSIFAYLDILEDSLKKKLSSEQKEEFATIRNNSDQLVSLINNILEMARMESNKFELIQTDVDVVETINGVVKSLDPVAKKNGNKIVTKFERVPKTIITDGQRFKEIFNNLISNAIKFTENGTITIEASKKGSDLAVTVRDTGVGIPDQKIKNLFQKFYQVDASISRKYGGTGLGLSITREIIRRQGGDIRVTSKKGKGTAFSFTLPIHPPKDLAKSDNEVSSKPHG